MLASPPNKTPGNHYKNEVDSYVGKRSLGILSSEEKRGWRMASQFHNPARPSPSPGPRSQGKLGLWETDIPTYYLGRKCGEGQRKSLVREAVSSWALPIQERGHWCTLQSESKEWVGAGPEAKSVALVQLPPHWKPEEWGISVPI